MPKQSRVGKLDPWLLNFLKQIICHEKHRFKRMFFLALLTLHTEEMKVKSGRGSNNQRFLMTFFHIFALLLIYISIFPLFK